MKKKSTFMRKLLATCLMLLLSAFAHAGAEGSFDNAFLIRSPGYLDSCNIHLGTNTAVVIFHSGIRMSDQKKGDTYVVISHSGEVIKATLDQFIDPNQCPALNLYDTGTVGILHVGTPVDWYSNDSDAVLGLKG